MRRIALLMPAKELLIILRRGDPPYKVVEDQK